MRFLNLWLQIERGGGRVRVAWCGGCMRNTIVFCSWISQIVLEWLYEGCDSDLSADFLNFGASNFPLIYIYIYFFLQCFKIVFFSLWRRDPVLELQFLLWLCTRKLLCVKTFFCKRLLCVQDFVCKSLLCVKTSLCVKASLCKSFCVCKRLPCVKALCVSVLCVNACCVWKLAVCKGLSV